MAPNQPTPPTSNDVAGSALFKKFLSSAEGYVRQPTRMKKLLTDAYQKASDKKEVGTLAHEAWDTLQTMFRLIKASVAGEYTGVPGTTVAAAVAVLIYFLSPIDLIPDFIPVLGLLDDVALVAWFSTTLKGEMDKFHEWETSSAALVKPAAAGAHALTDKDAPAPAARATATAAATVGNQAKHAADALDEQAQAAPGAPDRAQGGTTALSERAQPASESAKHAGTTDLPSAPAVGTPPAGAPHADALANTTDGSRTGNRDAPTDTGGNVR